MTPCRRLKQSAAVGQILADDAQTDAPAMILASTSGQKTWTGEPNVLDELTRCCLPCQGSLCMPLLP
ncbi:hypothetical protein PsYK624_160960 [Phanerochaete sordida]|uniref:Uncharacterized protein n=1 Tax=Phanerochaete sordida TaxID=48140 RepID=A0A9P3GSU8_9APHY|nr:hypothetical protein PsYK624_160960 [Phanerochaete sordida]